MKVVAIGSKFFVKFYRMFRVEGIEVSNSGEMLSAIQNIMKEGHVGVILVEKKMAKEIKEEIFQAKVEKPIPIIIDVDLSDMKNILSSLNNT